MSALPILPNRSKSTHTPPPRPILCGSGVGWQWTHNPQSDISVKPRITALFGPYPFIHGAFRGLRAWTSRDRSGQALPYFQVHFQVHFSWIIKELKNCNYCVMPFMLFSYSPILRKKFFVDCISYQSNFILLKDI